jgi:hypothetical protein
VRTPPRHLFTLAHCVCAHIRSRRWCQVIDAENLPEEYGGKSTCEGGCVPGGGKFCDQKDDGTSYNPLQATVGRKGASVRHYSRCGTVAVSELT